MFISATTRRLRDVTDREGRRRHVVVVGALATHAAMTGRIAIR
jgi:hypothetical protein